MQPEILISLVTVLMLAVGGSGAAGIYWQGNHTLGDSNDVVVSGADVQTTGIVNGSVYLISGNLSILGEVKGDVMQFGGSLDIGPDANIAGAVSALSGESDVDASATIEGGFSQGLPESAPSQSPLRRAITFIITYILLSVLAILVKRKNYLENLAGSLKKNAPLSFAVGTLASVAALSLLVVMAYTIILIPVSIIGILLGLVALGYSSITYGALIGDYFDKAGRLGTTKSLLLGILAFMAVFEILSFIPFLGGTIQVLAHATGIGAVLLSYFGVREYTPAS